MNRSYSIGTIVTEKYSQLKTVVSNLSKHIRILQLRKAVDGYRSRWLEYTLILATDGKLFKTLKLYGFCLWKVDLTLTPAVDSRKPDRPPNSEPSEQVVYVIFASAAGYLLDTGH